MKRTIIAVLTILLLAFSGCSKETEPTEIPGSDNEPESTRAIVTTEKYYSVEIDGKVYEASSQEEIDQIINEHIYGDLNTILGSYSSNGYIDTDKTGKPMIEIESGKYLGASSGNYVEFYFKVRNTSDVPIHTVSINVDVLDEYGDIVDTTHPQKSSTVQPGQAIVIDCIINNNRGGVTALVSSYSLYTMDDDYATGRIKQSPQITFEEAVSSVENTDVYVSIETQPTAKNISATEAYNIFDDAIDDLNDLVDDFSNALGYDNFNSFAEIEEYEDLWEDMSSEAKSIQKTFLENIPPAEYRVLWNDFADCIGEISQILEKGTNMDVNHDGDYTGSEMSALISEMRDEYVEAANESIELATEFFESFEEKPSSNNSTGTSTVKKVTCIECGKTASRTYTNPFSGAKEDYCETHYQEIIEIMSMMESDVGSSKQSKRTCEQCSREGTHKYNSFTGQTEYYCTQHYEELMDMLDSFGLS